MSTIKIPHVRCKICGFSTSDSNAESTHQVTESIKFTRCSLKTKKILELIHEHLIVSVNDAEELFSQIMELQNENSNFKLINCMELVK